MAKFSQKEISDPHNSSYITLQYKMWNNKVTSNTSSHEYIFA